jgi:LysM repeat protein
MSKYKNIIILLPVFIALNCAPGDHFRRTEGNNDPNDLFFEWSSADDNGIDYEDSISENNDYSSDIDERTPSENSIHSIKKQSDYFKRYSEKTISQKKDIKRDEKILKKQVTNVKIITKYKTYKVVKGDNLSRISDKFNVPVSELLKINKIKNNDKILSGTLIKIPDKIIITKSIKNNANKSISEAPRFIWPMKSVYGARRDGLDGVKPIGIIITGNSDNNVLSSADGIIEKIGYMRGFGNYIIIKHVNKYLTIYSNLKNIEVAEGDKIRKGESLGKLEGNKLHFQIGRSGKPEDPMSYLSRLN